MHAFATAFTCALKSTMTPRDLSWLTVGSATSATLTDFASLIFRNWAPEPISMTSDWSAFNIKSFSRNNLFTAREHDSRRWMSVSTVAAFNAKNSCVPSAYWWCQLSFLEHKGVITNSLLHNTSCYRYCDRLVGHPGRNTFFVVLAERLRGLPFERATVEHFWGG